MTVFIFMIFFYLKNIKFGSLVNSIKSAIAECEKPFKLKWCMWCLEAALLYLEHEKTFNCETCQLDVHRKKLALRKNILIQLQTDQFQQVFINRNNCMV